MVVTGSFERYFSPTNPSKRSSIYRLASFPLRVFISRWSQTFHNININNWKLPWSPPYWNRWRKLGTNRVRTLSDQLRQGTVSGKNRQANKLTDRLETIFFTLYALNYVYTMSTDSTKIVSNKAGDMIIFILIFLTICYSNWIQKFIYIYIYMVRNYTVLYTNIFYHNF